MIEKFRTPTFKVEKIMFDCKNKQIYVECKDLLFKDSERKILKTYILSFSHFKNDILENIALTIMDWGTKIKEEKVNKE